MESCDTEDDTKG